MPLDSGSSFDLDPVDIAEARAALEKILQSAEFVASPQLCAFLTFIVEAHLAGNDHMLKGQSIGTRVLGRKEGYDSQRDPIVRVEANRLRRTLAAYYARGGADDPVRIVVGRGSYVPSFERREVLAALDAGATQPPPPPPAPPPRARPGVFVTGVVLLALAIALFATFILLEQRPDGVAAATAAARPTAPAGSAPPPLPPAASRYLPSVEIARLRAPPDGEIAERAEELASGLTVALARFPELQVLVGGGEPADFRLEGELLSSDGKANVVMRLLSAGTAEVLWGASIEMPRAELMQRAGIERLVAMVMTAIATQSGAIAQYAPRGDASLPGGMSGHDCLIRAQLQRHRLDDEAWGRIDSCLKVIIHDHPNFATAPASRALLLMENYRLNRDPVAAQAALVEADELARLALRLEPANVRAMTAVATVAFAKGDLEAARRIGQQTIAANPHDPLSRSQYVLALIASGYPEQARLQSEAARALDPGHVSFYDSLDFLARFGRDPGPEPISGSVMADVSLLPYGAITRILVYDQAGPSAARDAARQALYDLMPLFATDMPAALSRQFPPSAFTRGLEDALRQAGVGVGNG